MNAAANRLAAARSPYLRQHADNPVEWYPWGPEALERARAEDKPILLSIGYSACHWCHVMARESFSDPDTAALMNELFVNVKVDREERPDLDKIYQAALSILTQQNGGWPLTMFLEPTAHAPFFGGTYFPKEPLRGMPPFREILTRVAAAYRDRRSDIEAQNAEVVSALRGIDDLPAVEGVTLRSKPLHDSRKFLESIHDRDHGGFGSAPKFPQASSLTRLARHHAQMRDRGIRDDKALKMFRRTLSHICDGGIFDHLGGGFARYAVDDAWMIPHFEKMLSDNGQLLALLADGFLLTGDRAFRERALATAEWLAREMRTPEGAFAASINAESEGEEGAFYVFSAEEAKAAVGEADWPLFAAYYGLDRAPNFEGRYHLYVAQSLNDACQVSGTAIGDAEARLAAARQRLFEVRERREHPEIDDKILTSWNALTIRGLARAGEVFGEPHLIDLARGAMDFLRGTLFDGTDLHAVYGAGSRGGPGFLDDYVFTIDALLALAQVRFDPEDLQFAVTLAERTLDAFEDPLGGFYFTPSDHEALLTRVKGLHDDALPGGNGVAARVFIELGELIGEPRYLEAAERTVQRAWPAITRAPAAHNALLDALELILGESRTVVLRGSEAETAEFRARASSHFLPHTRVLTIDRDASGLPEALAARTPADEGAVAYVCEGMHCRAPIRSLTAFESVLMHEANDANAPPADV